MPMPGSIKHAQIDKARSNVMLMVTVATVVVVFCLMSTKALLGQASYQRRVINTRHAGLHQLQANVTAAGQLVTQYDQVFEGNNPTNLIGGQNTQSSNATPPNGDNARIVLDALPSKYDFPALLTSVNYILNKNAVASAVITGNDDTATSNSSSSTNPQPVPIQLTVSGSASYAAIKNLISDFEQSIRPFDITNLQLGGSENSMTVSFNATTYYQPAKSLDLTTKEIK